MSNTARKARKKNGPQFTKAQKTPTPPEERSYVTNGVPGPGGTKWASYTRPRSESAIKRFLERFTPAPTE